MKKKVMLSMMAVSMVAAQLIGCGGQTANSSASDAAESSTPATEQTGETNGIDGLLEQGKLVVVTVDTQAPLGYRDENNNLVGFDIDCMEAIGDYLGLEIQWETTSFDGLVMGVNAGKYDVASAGIYVTEERATQVDFTDVVYNMDQVICLPKDNTEITKPQDLAGHIIGVQSGASEEEKVREIDGVQEADIREYQNVPDGLLDISSGRIDCFVTENLLAAYYGKELTILYDEPLESIETAMCVSKSNPEITKALDGAIQALKEDGTFKEISEKWFNGTDIISY